MRELTEKIFVCDHCQAEFWATRPAKYCSPRCRTAAHRARNKPTLLAAMVPKHRDYIEKWNVIRTASTYAEKMVIEIYNRYGIDAALLAISAGYGVQMNFDIKTEAQYRAEELAEADRLHAERKTAEREAAEPRWWLEPAAE